MIYVPMQVYKYYNNILINIFLSILFIIFPKDPFILIESIFCKNICNCSYKVIK